MGRGGALNEKATRALRAVLRRRLETLPESRAATAPQSEGDALEAIARGAAAIAADHVARARVAADPEQAKRHLDCALAAMKLATKEAPADAAGTTIVINEAPDVAPVADGDSRVQSEQAADASTSPVH